MNMTYKTTIEAVLEVANTEVVLTSLAKAGRGSVRLSMVTSFDEFARKLLITGRFASATTHFKLEYDLQNGTKALSMFSADELADAVVAYNNYVAVL